MKPHSWPESPWACEKRNSHKVSGPSLPAFVLLIGGIEVGLSHFPFFACLSSEFRLVSSVSPGLPAILLSGKMDSACLLQQFVWPWLNSGQSAGGDLRTLWRTPCPELRLRVGGNHWSEAHHGPSLGLHLRLQKVNLRSVSSTRACPRLEYL